jgi:Zn-dependent peptidase ImmA (M78 family)
MSLGHEMVDGFSVPFNRRPLVLLAEDKSNYVRSRFDASHELGHLVMHSESTPGDRIVERQAQDFASCFLLPREAALTELPGKLDSAGWARLAQMKQYWGISIGALLFRARALGVISQATHRNAMKYMSAKGWRTVEPGDREMGKPEAPILLERALRQMEIETGMKVDDVFNEAQLPSDDMLLLVRAAVDPRPTIELS